MRYSRIIFVCQDNTILSPMAEAILKDMVKNDRIEVLSRGMVVLFPEPFHENVKKLLKKQKIRFQGEATAPFCKEEVNDETLILTMTISQSIKIAEECGNMEQVETLKKFAGEEGDIADPFGSGYEEYEAIFLELKRLIGRMILRLE